MLQNNYLMFSNSIKEKYAGMAARINPLALVFLQAQEEPEEAAPVTHITNINQYFYRTNQYIYNNIVNRYSRNYQNILQTVHRNELYSSSPNFKKNSINPVAYEYQRKETAVENAAGIRQMLEQIIKEYRDREQKELLSQGNTVFRDHLREIIRRCSRHLSEAEGLEGVVRLFIKSNEKSPAGAQARMQESLRQAVEKVLQKTIRESVQSAVVNEEFVRKILTEIRHGLQEEAAEKVGKEYIAYTLSLVEQKLIEEKILEHSIFNQGKLRQNISAGEKWNEEAIIQNIMTAIIPSVKMGLEREWEAIAERSHIKEKEAKEYIKYSLEKHFIPFVAAASKGTSKAVIRQEIHRLLQREGTAQELVEQICSMDLTEAIEVNNMTLLSSTESLLQQVLEHTDSFKKGKTKYERQVISRLLPLPVRPMTLSFRTEKEAGPQSQNQIPEAPITQRRVIQIVKQQNSTERKYYTHFIERFLRRNEEEKQPEIDRSELPAGIIYYKKPQEAVRFINQDVVHIAQLDMSYNIHTGAVTTNHHRDSIGYNIIDQGSRMANYDISVSYGDSVIDYSNHPPAAVNSQGSPDSSANMNQGSGSNVNSNRNPSDSSINHRSNISIDQGGSNSGNYQANQSGSNSGNYYANQGGSNSGNYQANQGGSSGGNHHTNQGGSSSVNYNQIEQHNSTASYSNSMVNHIGYDGSVVDYSNHPAIHTDNSNIHNDGVAPANPSISTKPSVSTKYANSSKDQGGSNSGNYQASQGGSSGGNHHTNQGGSVNYNQIEQHNSTASYSNSMVNQISYVDSVVDYSNHPAIHTDNSSIHNDGVAPANPSVSTKYANSSKDQGGSNSGKYQASQDGSNSGKYQASQGGSNSGKYQASQGGSNSGNYQASQGGSSSGNHHTNQGGSVNYNQIEQHNSTASYSNSMVNQIGYGDSVVDYSNHPAIHTDNSNIRNDGVAPANPSVSTKYANSSKDQGGSNSGKYQASQGDSNGGKYQASQGGSNSGKYQASQGGSNSGKYQASQGGSNSGNYHTSQGGSVNNNHIEQHSSTASYSNSMVNQIGYGHSVVDYSNHPANHESVGNGGQGNNSGIGNTYSSNTYSNHSITHGNAATNHNSPISYGDSVVDYSNHPMQNISTGDIGPGTDRNTGNTNVITNHSQQELAHHPIERAMMQRQQIIRRIEHQIELRIEKQLERQVEQRIITWQEGQAGQGMQPEQQAASRTEKLVYKEESQVAGQSQTAQPLPDYRVTEHMPEFKEKRLIHRAVPDFTREGRDFLTVIESQKPQVLLTLASMQQPPVSLVYKQETVQDGEGKEGEKRQEDTTTEFFEDIVFEKRVLNTQKDIYENTEQTVEMPAQWNGRTGIAGKEEGVEKLISESVSRHVEENISQISKRVYRSIENQLKKERERRGM